MKRSQPSFCAPQPKKQRFNSPTQVLSIPSIFQSQPTIPNVPPVDEPSYDTLFDTELLDKLIANVDDLYATMSTPTVAQPTMSHLPFVCELDLNEIVEPQCTMVRLPQIDGINDNHVHKSVKESSSNQFPLLIQRTLQHHVNSSCGSLFLNTKICDSVSRAWTPSQYTRVTLLFEAPLNDSRIISNPSVLVHSLIAGGRNKKVYQPSSPGFLLNASIQCGDNQVNQNQLSVRKEKELKIEQVPNSKYYKLEFDVQLKCTSAKCWEQWKEFRITITFILEHLASSQKCKWSFDVVSLGNRSDAKKRRKDVKNREFVVYPNQLMREMSNVLLKEFKPIVQLGLGVLQLTHHMTIPESLQSNKKRKKNDSIPIAEKVSVESTNDWKILYEKGREHFNKDALVALKCFEKCFFLLYPDLNQQSTVITLLTKIKSYKLNNVGIALLLDIASLNGRIDSTENPNLVEIVKICTQKAFEAGYIDLAIKSTYVLAEIKFMYLRKKIRVMNKISLPEIQSLFANSFKVCDEQLEYLRKKMQSCDNQEKQLLANTAACLANLKGVLYGMLNAKIKSPLFFAEELRWKFEAYTTRAAINPFSTEFAQSCHNIGMSLQQLIPPLASDRNYNDSLELLQIIKLFKERAVYIQSLHPQEQHVAYYLYKRNLFKTQMQIAQRIHKIKASKKTEQATKKAQNQMQIAEMEFQQMNLGYWNTRIVAIR